MSAIEGTLLDNFESLPVEGKMHPRRTPFVFQTVHRPTVYIYRDGSDEPYCAEAASLPGVLSEGTTKDEAARNIREALLAAIETYKSLGNGAVPWQPRREPPNAAEVEIRAITLDE